MVVTRFAPSPTGFLHLGHAYAALFAWRAARLGGGRFLIRMEDIDHTRCRREYESAILEDMAWLGLDWDGPIRRQSEHLADYQDALDRLRRLGVIYPCYCTRAEIAAEIARAGAAPHAPLGRLAYHTVLEPSDGAVRSPALATGGAVAAPAAGGGVAVPATGGGGAGIGPEGPRYPGTCRQRAVNGNGALRSGTAPSALRLDAAAAAARTGPLVWRGAGPGGGAEGDFGADHGVDYIVDPGLLGDVVLARKETPTSYHLSVTVDDYLQGITLVTRGADLVAATHVHRLLQALLGYPPPRWHHHRLLTDASGRRLAKRDQALTLRALRAAGHSAADVRTMAGIPDLNSGLP